MSSLICLWYIHMGQIPQDGNFGQNVVPSFLKYSLRVTKPDYISLIFQLILVNCVPWTLETPWHGLGKFFKVLRSTPVLALMSHFWVKIRAPVRPNLQRWTWFDLLIILGVKFWWFSSFKPTLAFLEAELTLFKDWAKSPSSSWLFESPHCVDEQAVRGASEEAKERKANALSFSQGRNLLKIGP